LEYLKLALRQPNAYRTILAVTFTNKATQEMKGRVLQYLHQVAKAESSPIRTKLAQELTLSEAELSRQAGQCLQRLLHGYSYFSVMTIDAFFQKVVRGFAREMGLQAGFTVELDLNRVLDEVIDQLLEKVGEKQYSSIRRWLTRFAEEKIESGSSWDFRKEIKQLAQELFKENYREMALSSSATVTPQSAESLLQQLRELQQAFETRMADLGKATLNVLEQHQLDVNDFSYGKSGVVGYLTKIADGTQFTPTKRVLLAQENLESWAKKTDPQRDHLLSVAAELHPYLIEALDFYNEAGPLYHSAVQMQRFMYTYGILNHLEEQLDQYKRENDVMLISDAPTFLKDIIGKDDTPFIYEKIGSYYQHFLIDEFQDTSGLQWMNFRPLVENSLDSGNRNLVVGDVKQSIYRWRGGDWQLLLHKIQQDVQEWRTEIRELNHNFRSRQHVLEFNNALFQAAAQELFLYITNELMADVADEPLREQLLQQASVLQAAYLDVDQKLPATYHPSDDWHGHVKIKLLEDAQCLDETGEPIHWRTHVCTHLPGMVESLQAEGYAARDIAFLVRNKRDGQAVVDTFMQYKHEGKAQSDFNYEVVSSESLMLASSLTVSLLVELMRFLDNTNDAIVRSSILYKYHRLTSPELHSDTLHALFSKQNDKEDLSNFFQQLPPDFELYQTYLNKLPIYELVENLVLIYELGQNSEKAYLQAFQDAVLQYSLTEQGDLRSFLVWWDERGANSSAQVSEVTDAMRVMTIHKAKGLQFKIVILPFCDWSLDHQPFSTNILWTYPQDPTLANAGLVPMKYTSQLTQTVFTEDYYEEKIRIHMDHLNLLYVAFTRAEEGLYAFARPVPKRNGVFPLNGIANLLRVVLPDLEQSDSLAGWDEMGQLYEAGSFPSGTSSSQPDPSVIGLSDYSSVRWRDRLRVRPLSRGFFVTKVGTVSNVALLQQLLIQLPSANQLNRQLEKIAFERGLTDQERKTLQDQATSFINKSEVRDWYQPHQPLLIQRPLLTKPNRTVVLDRALVASSNITVINFYTHHDESEKTKSLTMAKGYLVAHYESVEMFLVNVSCLNIKKLSL